MGYIAFVLNHMSRVRSKQYVEQSMRSRGVTHHLHKMIKGLKSNFGGAIPNEMKKKAREECMLDRGFYRLQISCSDEQYPILQWLTGTFYDEPANGLHSFYGIGNGCRMYLLYDISVGLWQKVPTSPILQQLCYMLVIELCQQKILVRVCNNYRGKRSIKIN
jgi:hypothetical protein